MLDFKYIQDYEFNVVCPNSFNNRYLKLMLQLKNNESDPHVERLKIAYKEMKNEGSKIIYTIWTCGGHLWNWDPITKQHYRIGPATNYSDECWKEAESFILETISLGLG